MRLPDFTALGTIETPSPPTGIARVDNPAAAAEASGQLGAIGQETGMKVQDMVNVADVNNAMSNDFEPKLRSLGQNFYSLQGKAALDAGPQYREDVMQAMSDAAEKLNGVARTNFLNMARASVDNELYRASMHAGEQAKTYYNESNNAAMSNYTLNYQDNLLTNPKEAQDNYDNAFHQLSMYHKSIGLTDDDPIAVDQQNRLEGMFEKAKEDAVTSSYLMLPPKKQTEQSQQPYWPTSNNTSGSASSAFNLGNVKTASGAANNTMDFQNPATPVDGVILTANTLRTGYAGMTLQDIGKKWTGESQEKVDAWVSNVSKTSGFAAGDTPNLNDPADLTKLLSGVAVAEKSPTDRKNFTPDVISKGVQASLSGSQPNLAPGQYASNDNIQSDAGGNISSTGAPVSGGKPTYMGVEISPELADKLTRIGVANNRIADAQQKQQYQKDADTLANDPHFISMAQVPDNIVAGYSTNPNMQRFLEAHAEYNLKNSQNIVDADKKQYGSGFYNLLQNVYSPNGISSPEQLYQYMGKNGILTVDGFNTLKGEIIQKNSPEGQAVATAKSQLFAQGEKAIFGDGKSYGIIDPKDEELHQKWLAVALSDYNAGIKSGKSPTQLLTPESPDYIGKSVTMFRRTEDQRIKDNLGIQVNPLDDIYQNIQYGRLPEEQAKVLVPAILREQYAAGKISKADVEQQMVRFKLLNEKSEPQVPRPE